MRKSRKLTPEQTAAARDAVVKAIREASEPVPAAVLVTLPGVLVKAAELSGLLAEDLAAGRVFPWGKRYWNRDVRIAARERILQAIAEAGEPLAAAALVKFPGVLIKAGELPGLLAEDLAAGRVFPWGKRYWNRDVRIAARERILQTIAEAGEPLAAAALVKLPGVIVKAGELPGLLAEDLAAGRLFAWGKRYWDRDVRIAARERILQAVAEAGEPLAAAALVKLPGVIVKAGELPGLLAEDLAAGRLFAWGKRYWNRDVRSAARERILQTIAEAGEPLAAAALVKLPGVIVKAGELPGLLAEDLAAGRLFAWGKRYWNRDVRIAARERLVDLATRENLSKNELTAKAGADTPAIDARDVRAACAALVKEGDLIATLKPRVAPASSPVQADSVREAADKIFVAMNRIAFAPGTTVTFYRLRQQPELAGMPKKIFDDAALLLQQDRRALLTAHGHAAALTPAEQDELVTDGFGNYYASIYSR